MHYLLTYILFNKIYKLYHYIINTIDIYLYVLLSLKIGTI